MVKLNHPVRVGKEFVTPYLVEGTNVYCINRMKETVILSADKFVTPKKRKKITVPNQVYVSPVVPVAKPKKVVVAPKPIPPKEEVVVIKKEPVIEPGSYSMESSLIIRLSGSAGSTYEMKEEIVVPPVVDNSRYVRPTLDDEYI